MSFTINNKVINKKNVSDIVNIKSGLLNNSIDLVLSSTTNKVVQQNKALASSIVGASNTLSLNRIKCNTFNVSDISQTATSNSTTNTITQQSNSSNINTLSTNISSNYDKTISTIKLVDPTKYKSPSTIKLNELLEKNTSDIYSLNTICGKTDIFTISNNCTGSDNTTFDLNASLKKELKLDESFKIVDTADINNNINNVIKSQNLATCSAVAVADNKIFIQNVICNTANINNISQEALSNLYLKCVFNQSNITNITTNISNKIINRYNQLYDKVAEIAKKEGLDYYNRATDILDAHANAGIDRIANAAGLLENNINKKPINQEADTLTTILNYINENWIVLLIGMSLIIVALML